MKCGVLCFIVVMCCMVLRRDCSVVSDALSEIVCVKGSDRVSSEGRLVVLDFTALLTSLVSVAF